MEDVKMSDDIRMAAQRAFDKHLPSLINKDAYDAALRAIEDGILAERQRCYDIIYCDCGSYCDLKEAAEKIISSAA